MASTTPEPSLTSTLGFIKTTAENATSFFVPSSKDLLLLMPRMAARAGTFMTNDLPGALENIFGGQMAGRVIAEATGERAGPLLSAAGTAQATMAAGADGIPIDGVGGHGFMSSFTLQQLRTFGGIFTYITSKWAMGCFIVAVLLNRTSIYASSRRNLRLSWRLRLALRILPIILLVGVARSLLQALRCQTSPEFSVMRYGVPDKFTALDFSEDAGVLHAMSSSLLFWQTDLDSCRAVNMVPLEEQQQTSPMGSLSLLWPSFQSFCFAQFVETLSCALQGHATATETGMSLFEHSLAFAEAEAMVSSELGHNLLGNASNIDYGIADPQEALKEMISPITRSFVVSRFNTPPEVLLMALISCLNNLSSQLLGVFGLQARYRLINTGIWGMAFMASTLWSLVTFPIDGGVNSGIWRFPTVCVVGFIPHTLILLGIFLCACIYAIALTIAIFSPPDTFNRNLSWTERVKMAHENMQANIPLSGLRVNLREDFYTALLRVGFTALTAASEAVYLNEGRRINVGHWTWLEEERMDEIARLNSSATDQPIGIEGVANGIVLSAVAESSQDILASSPLQGGYSRERSTQSLKSKPKRMNTTSSGVGARQRGTRYMLAFTFLSRIFWLFVGWLSLFLIKLLDSIGIQRRPGWLSSLLSEPKAIKTAEVKSLGSQKKELDFWILSDDGELKLPQTTDVDVEAETKRRLQLAAQTWGTEQEKQLDDSLYSWFTSGGWWGEKDESGEYTELPWQDDDTTSVVSTSTSVAESEWSTDSSGRQTPTQQDPFPISREPTPLLDHALDPSQLARLLDPQDLEAKTEARMLAAHLASNGPVTRSRFRQASTDLKCQVLTSTRYRPKGFMPSSPDGKLTPLEEAELLEYLIVRSRDKGRRAGGQTGGGSSDSIAEWADGGEGLGAGGPMCVVCQSSPRTILAWPCRCLSLCEECRISLAMNNFATCVCCRQEVVAFSRLYVP